MSKQQQGLNTPYDNAFKSIIKKCPRMALFLINEMFYKTNLIDEKYDGTERIELLDKEIPNLAFGPSEMDLRVAVYKSTRRTFHMECQSTSDGTMILRMVRYDTWTALDEAAYTQSFVRVKLDDSGVLFLRSTRNTPDVMTVLLEVPQGKSVSYQIPVIKMQDYTLDYLIENQLYILLPFFFFNYEEYLRQVPQNPDIFVEIRLVYARILFALGSLEYDQVITAYEASTIADALKTVLKALGKTNKADKEVTSIMGGTILEFSADKFFNAGKAEGRAEGRAEGKAEGKAEGRTEGKAEGVISTLVSLVKDGILTESAAAKRANMTEDDFRAALLSTTNP